MTYTQFLLGALLLSALLSVAGTWAVLSVPAGSRRPVGLSVLALPLFVLAVATAHLLPRYRDACVTFAGRDWVLSAGLLAAVWGSVAGVLLVNLVRVRTAGRLVRACPLLEDPRLLQRFATLSLRLKVPVPELRVLDLSVPVALSGWGRRASVVISRWFLEHLDREELAAVLAHELAHLARRAPQVLCLARLVRDATWYFPWTRFVLAALEAEEELEADALAVESTGRPLALASALGRLTEHALLAAGPLPALAASPGRLVEQRLLEGRVQPSRAVGGWLLASSVAAAAVRVVPPVVAGSAAVLSLYCRVGPV